MTCTAVLLAGSRPGKDSFAARFGTDLKALIPIAGQPMILRPLRTLLKSERIGRVLVLTQAPEKISAVLTDDPRLLVRASGATIAATLLSLCNDPRTHWPLLVTTADHALLDEAMIEDFYRQAGAADIAIAVVERADLLRRLPQSRRTWIRFKGGAYSGANLFLLRSPKVASAIQLWRSAEQDRKTGWRLLWRFGPMLLLGSALRLLTLDRVVQRLSRKLGLKIRTVRMSDPLAAVDVDKPSDHALVEAILSGRA